MPLVSGVFDASVSQLGYYTQLARTKLYLPIGKVGRACSFHCVTQNTMCKMNILISQLFHELLTHTVDCDKNPIEAHTFHVKPAAHTMWGKVVVSTFSTVPLV